MKIVDRIHDGTFGRASVVAIACFAAFVLAQNGCSSSSSGGAGPTQDSGTLSGGGCLAGETLQKVGSETLCCGGTAPDLTCFSTGPRAGDVCASADPQATATDRVTVKLDTCVSDSCDGDHTATTYDAEVSDTAQPLSCQNGVYVANGETSLHVVQRVCADGAPLVCGGSGYYGYSYGYGSSELRTRSVAVSSSVCSQGTTPAAACDVGTL